MHLTLVIEEPEGVYRVRVHANNTWELTLQRVDEFERDLCSGSITSDGRVIGYPFRGGHISEVLERFHRILAVICGEPVKETG